MAQTVAAHILSITMMNGLREADWRIAIHNDYTLNGADMTFLLMTHPSGRFVKGEAMCYEDAIAQCFSAVSRFMNVRLVSPAEVNAKIGVPS